MPLFSFWEYFTMFLPTQIYLLTYIQRQQDQLMLLKAHSLHFSFIFLTVYAVALFVIWFFVTIDQMIGCSRSDLHVHPYIYLLRYSSD